MILRTCVFTVFGLKLPREIEVGEATIMPVPTDPEHEIWGSEFQRGLVAPKEGDEVGTISLLRVPYDASLGERADDLAREKAKAALARLRLALDRERDIHDRQLRFRLGGARWILGGTTGFAEGEGAAYPLEAGEADPMLDRLVDDRFLRIPLEPATDVEKRAAIAVGWIDRAHFEDSEMVQLLFRFSALEAILGDTSEGLKAHELAIRRATLAFELDGMFRHPSKTFDLYDQVRSAAVHGESVPVLPPGEASKFAWDVRDALDQYLRFAEGKGLSKRKDIRVALDSSESRAKIIGPLVAEDPKKWRPYVNG